jgi:hypothetical protein
MPSKILSTILDFDVSKTYLPAIKNATFSLVNRTLAVLRDGFTSYKCDLELRTDFQYTGINKFVTFVPNSTYYYGFNKKFIDDFGVYDPMQALGEFSRVAPDKRIIKGDIIALLGSHTQIDSHDAFLYNMLISYGKALLSKFDTKNKDTFKATCFGYKDTHTAVFNRYGGIQTDFEIELGPPVTMEELEKTLWDLRTEENYFKRPYVLHYNAADPNQEAFYLWHVLGRKQTSQLNFDVSLPGLETSNLLLDPIGGKNTLPYDFQAINWNEPDLLWQWIMDYVRLNRLMQPFSAVLESFSAMGPQPLFESAEAHAWQYAVRTLTLSKFSPTRARFRTNLEGEPYSTSTTAIELSLSELAQPNLYLHRSALVNYYELYGLYAMVQNISRGRADYYNAYTSNEDGYSVFNSIYSRAISVSSITGLEIISTMHSSCNVTWDLSAMREVQDVPNYESYDNLHSGGIKVKGIYAPVTGSLIIGAVAGELPAIQHLKAVQKLPSDIEQPQFLTADQVLLISNAYRLFGNDTRFISEMTDTEINPWASATNCIIEPCSITTNLGKVSKFMALDNQARSGRKHIIPNIHSLLSAKTVTLCIQRPSLKVTEFRSRTLPARPYLGKNIFVAPLEYTVNAMYTSGIVKFRSKEMPQDIIRPSGFRVSEASYPPVHPEGRHIQADPTPVSVSAVDTNPLTTALTAEQKPPPLTGG